MQASNTLATAYPAYDSYKDIGVDWLGKIPEEWDLVPNKQIFKLKNTKVGKESYKFDLLSLTLNGVILRDIENPEGKFPAEFDTYQVVEINDFIFCLFDVEETPRTVGLSSYNGMITGAYTVFSCNTNYDCKFLYYFYLNLDKNKRMKPLYKGLRNTIPKDWFLSFKTFVPPLEVQTKIAEFLDQKTTQIDQAIALKQQQINKLNEYKQIVIQNAVTKGLNPDAPMKDSGVEWIGKIPEHWEVKKLKFLLDDKLKYGSNDAYDSNDLNLPRYIRITDIDNDGNLRKEGFCSLTLSKAEEYILKDMDILLARSGATIGKSFIYKKSECPVACHAGYLIRVRANKEIITPHILNYYFQSKGYWNWIDSINIQSTIQNVSAEKYSSLLVCVPPKNEQLSVVKYLDGFIKKIKSTDLALRNQIAHLQEYKTVLINQAVTGKIKV